MFGIGPGFFNNQLVGPSDPYFSDVALLLHMEGVNGGTSFIDSSNFHRSCVANAGTDTSTDNYKFGSSSCFITGTDSGGISIGSSPSLGFGAGDFTIEGWVNPSNVTSRLNTLFDNRLSTAVGIQVFVGGGTYSVPASVIGCSSNSAILGTGGNISPNVWSHVAVTRSSGTIRAFINGVLAFSVSDSRTYDSAPAVYIGRDQAGTSFQGFGGYIDDVRVTTGISRYTSNFTPPTAAFPDH